MEATITVREVLLLLLAADSYPCLGNGDSQICDLMEADALKLAPRALSSPDDPPEFGRWIETLLKPQLRHSRTVTAIAVASSGRDVGAVTAVRFNSD